MGEYVMPRSTICFILAALCGLPAWLVEVKALPYAVQLTWVVGLVSVVLLGGFFWAKDGR